MTKKPPEGQQPTLFPTDPDQTPEPEDNATQKPSGGHYAIQDDHARTPDGTEGVLRAASPAAQTPDDRGTLREGIEERSRSMEEASHSIATGKRAEPDRQRSPGDGAQGTPGAIAERIADGRSRGSGPRRGDAVYPTSHVSRVIASRRQPTLFDSHPADPTSADPPPPGAKTDGTLISPPGRASGKPVPPEGLPQFSAGPVAARAEPRLGADSPASRQAPEAGPETQSGGDREMMTTQLSFQLDLPPPAPSRVPFKSNLQGAAKTPPATPTSEPIASGEKAKALDIIAAIKTLKTIEQKKRPATLEEKQVLSRFAGFGPVAL